MLVLRFRFHLRGPFWSTVPSPDRQKMEPQLDEPKKTHGPLLQLAVLETKIVF